ncbi:IS1 family transposase [Rickettsia endosymbiont of Cantharis rufa]|uniref:IS1 family transposase n=1 Tax=Rickettsia endosymbiont of Cantharis rufa TaxID=3066248 RepID=UPI0031331061
MNKITKYIVHIFCLDFSGHYKVGINTVIRVLKKNLALKKINHSINTIEVIIAPEIDEQWSYVQNKSKQRWL